MGYRNLRSSFAHYIVGFFWRIPDVEIGFFTGKWNWVGWVDLVPGSRFKVPGGSEFRSQYSESRK